MLSPMLTKIIFSLILSAHGGEEKLPQWVNSPQKHCSSKMLCAVGEAAGMSQAKAQARNAIAKVFKTQIKSEFSELVFANDKMSGAEMAQSTQELTDITLEGVFIKEVHETKLGYYALAALDKVKMSQAFSEKIKKLDDELLVAFKSATVGDLVKMGPMLVERSLYYDRVHFLTGRKIALPFSYKSYLKKKKRVIKTITIEVGSQLQMPKELISSIASKLSGLGYKLKTGGKSSGAATHFLTGKLSNKKEYLNVDGFERHSFELILKAKNKAQKETGFLKFNTTMTGRNFEQIQEKAINGIEFYLDKNIHKLNIE
ncbi:MAG: LPP20 family lipoprotein [Bdellovibrionota bacterium]|nr:LPP20 family lipoprotein [Bdellovibrionota bacterium]